MVELMTICQSALIGCNNLFTHPDQAQEVKQADKGEQIFNFTMTAVEGLPHFLLPQYLNNFYKNVIFIALKKYYNER